VFFFYITVYISLLSANRRNNYVARLFFFCAFMIHIGIFVSANNISHEIDLLSTRNCQMMTYIL